MRYCFCDHVVQPKKILHRKTPIPQVVLLKGTKSELKGNIGTEQGYKDATDRSGLWRLCLYVQRVNLRVGSLLFVNLLSNLPTSGKALTYNVVTTH